MVGNIDRERMRDAFHRQAGDYDRYAVVQRRVVEKLIAAVKGEAPAPARLLDIGAGTGNLLAKLRAEYPDALALGADLAFGMCRAASATLAGERVALVTADAERLPFAADSFDLVVSTSTYQWLTSLDGAFSEVRRVLAPGGLFCFAFFGANTLFELRESYKSVLNEGPDRTHCFSSRADVQAALARTGFDGAAVSSELEVEIHPDVPQLLKSLKKIGAGTTAPVAAKGLSERRVMLDMMDAYRAKYGRGEGVPATYEVIYGIGRKQGAE